MIKFENVNLKYIQDFYCLYNFNVEILSNTLFIGDEFLGTHSIMRLLAKIDKSYDGKIFIDKENIKTIKDKNLNIAYIPQKSELFLHKSLEKNLSFPLKIRKINKKVIKNTVNDAIFKYNFNKFPKKIKHMSASEKKIISLVRAVLRKPKYILLEDFFEDLDENHTELAIKILNDAKEFSIIIACEKDIEHIKYFDNFNVISLFKF